MKINNDNTITEATRAELMGVYLRQGYDDFMDFNAFLDVCRANGTVVVEEGGNDDRMHNHNRQNGQGGDHHGYTVRSVTDPPRTADGSGKRFR